jgi:hypothetical protein
MKTSEAKRIIANGLAVLHHQPYKLTAKTISFQDLARADCIFVKIHGWMPSPDWSALDNLARGNGFRIET